MKQNGIEDFVIHAPYIINLGNSVNPETYSLAVDFLALELERTIAMGSRVLILHPGAHVGAGYRNRAAPDHPGTECGIDSGHSLLYSTGDHGGQGFGNRPQL